MPELRPLVEVALHCQLAGVGPKTEEPVCRTHTSWVSATENRPDLRLWKFFSYWNSPNFSSWQVSCTNNICDNREPAWGLN